MKLLMLRILALSAVVICCINQLKAQDKLNIKYGKLAVADFAVASALVDSNANAIVLADIGSTEFQGNNKGRLSLIFKRHKRIKILNKNGFDAAKVEISLYISNSGDEEKLDDVKAVTYNLEGDKIVETKLETKNIFKEQVRKNIVTKKFTLPAVKEGSIIDYTYTINSDFIFNLQPWEFQGEYPCLWSEYEVNIPEFYNYVFLSQGSQAFHTNKTTNSSTSYHLNSASGAERSESFSITANVSTNRWVMKDVPALKNESFITTLSNHISKIDFQLSQINYPNQPVQNIMGTWGKVSEERLKDESFGVPIERGNGWLDDEIKIITKNSSNKLEAAQKIYAYVRDNFTRTGNGTYISDNTSLKDIFKKRSGNIAEINLLLIAMLRHEKIEAEPVILSTRGNGFAHAIYPLMGKFNYLVCQAVIDSSRYYLDAGLPRLGFGMLPEYCYNGRARIISTVPAAVDFEADMLLENKATTIIIVNSAQKGMEGGFTTTLGMYESLELRNKLAKTNKEDYFKEVEKGYGNEMKITNGEIDSLKIYEQPVTLKYDMKFDLGDDDVIYFNPLLNEATKQNPFKSMSRLYPVEMPYRFNETINVNMEVPKGYKVDELPKSTRVKLNEDEGMFEYIVKNNGDNIQLRCRLVLGKANYATEDYQTIRDFFGFVVKKQAEQIVFKKAK